MNRLLENRVVVITGAAGGIGAATAELAAKEGAKFVAIIDMNYELATQKAYNLLDTYQTPTRGYKVDVTQFSQCEAVTKDIISHCEQIDVLINSAGITKDNLMLRLSEMEWDTVIDVNLKGTFNFSKAVMKYMIRQEDGGSIVNIASVVGQTGNPGQTNYCASKGGVIALTKACAKEYAKRKVRVNAVAPGFIDTPMTQGLPAVVKQQMLDTIPVGRVGSPQEVAEAILFLASSRASYISGAILNIDGGMGCG